MQKQKSTKNITYQVPQNESITDTQKKEQLTADNPAKNGNVNNENLIKNQQNQDKVKLNQSNKTRQKSQSKTNSKSKKKTNNVQKPFVFAIVILSILLAGSLVYNFSGGFYFDNSLTYESSLGEKHKIIMNDALPISYSILVEGKVIVGDEIYQSISIKLPSLNLEGKKLYVKLSLGQSQIPISVLGFDNWLFKEDENIYEYTGSISPLGTIGLCNKFVIGGENQLKGNIVYTFNIVAWLGD